MKWFSKLTLAGAIALGSMIGATAVAAPPAPPPVGTQPPIAQPLAGADLYSRTLHGVALVVTPKGEGTAWIVDRERRLLMTNFHVIASDRDEAADDVLLVFPEYKDGEAIAERDYYMDDLLGRAISAKVVQADKDRDLAIIEADTLPDTAKALPLARKGARPGDEVASIGNPGASQALWVYNKGVVRAVYNEDAERVVETQNPLNPGDSGGPMVNAAGEVVAINVAVNREGSLLSIGIDLSEMKTVLNDYTSNPPLVKKAPALKGADTHVSRGNTAKEAKQYDKAIAEYAAALQIDPKNLEALKQRAWVHNEIQQFPEALADCNAALQIAPDELFALRERVYAYKHLDRFARVVQDCDHILTLQPNDAKALLDRGSAYEELDFLDKAQEDYEAAFLNAPPGSALEKDALAKAQQIMEKQQEVVVVPEK
jgi:S1-C subfamily serine protease